MPGTAAIPVPPFALPQGRRTALSMTGKKGPGLEQGTNRWARRTQERLCICSSEGTCFISPDNPSRAKPGEKQLENLCVQIGLRNICSSEVGEEIWPKHGAFTARENKYFHFGLFIRQREPAVLSGTVQLGAFSQGDSQLPRLGNRSWPQSRSCSRRLGAARGASLAGREKCILVEPSAASKHVGAVSSSAPVPRASEAEQERSP